MRALRINIFVGVVTLLLLCFHLYKDENNKNSKENISGKENIQLERLNMHFYNSIFQSIENNNKIIENNLLNWMKTQLEGKPIDFNKPILVFNYSIYSCTSCIDFVYEKLAANFNYKLDNVNQLLFIVEKGNPLLKGKIEQNVNLNTKRLYLPVEKEEIPFLFILNNGLVENLFVPDTNFPELTDFYLKEINKRYLIGKLHK